MLQNTISPTTEPTENSYIEKKASQGPLIFYFL